MLFSNGQFDVMDQWYVFDKEKRSFKKVDGVPTFSIALHYTGVPAIYDEYTDSKKFTLSLEEHGMVGVKSDIDTIDGRIDRQYPNLDYYRCVEYMRRRALEFLKERGSNRDANSFLIRISIPTYQTPVRGQ